MALNSDKISISFPAEELGLIDERVKELGLPKHGGRSRYFQMLREYDKHLKLQLHPHAKSRSWHFFPEGEDYRDLAAEASLLAAAKAEEAKKKKP